MLRIAPIPTTLGARAPRFVDACECTDMCAPSPVGLFVAATLTDAKMMLMLGFNAPHPTKYVAKSIHATCLLSLLRESAREASKKWCVASAVTVLEREVCVLKGCKCETMQPAHHTCQKPALCDIIQSIYFPCIPPHNKNKHTHTPQTSRQLSPSACSFGVIAMAHVRVEYVHFFFLPIFHAISIFIL